jgi:hypothetical protein
MLRLTKPAFRALVRVAVADIDGEKHSTKRSTVRVMPHHQFATIDNFFLLAGQK